MDPKESWSKLTERANRARCWSATNTTAALDSVAPLCVPFAVRWDAEADRRRQLRTEANLKALMDATKAYNSARSRAAQASHQRKQARTGHKNPLAAARRSARTADKAAGQQREAAKTALKSAKRNYPMTLPGIAARAHLAHAVPAGLASYLLSTPQDWAVWPGSLSTGLIGLNVAALWLGRRKSGASVADDTASEEERKLMERLDPSYWVQHADERGLGGTVTTPPALTPAGIVTEVRLDGTWTVDKLRSSEASVRALLGARTALPAVIRPGARGGWATLTLRTRSAADGADLKWSPGAAFGVDTITGDEIRIPLGQRMLIAGRSGAGKSWSVRPLLYDASEGESHALVIIDLKQVEGRLWDHRARVATTPEDVVALVEELVEEMTERLGMIPKGQDTLPPSPERPRITVFVDEGGEVTTAVKEALAGLESLARMGRAPIIDLWWATQKPTMSGSSPGIPAQIAPQLSTVVSLAVSTPTEARTVLGEDAQARGWRAEDLPAPGYALVRSGPGSKPNPVRTRALSPKEVVALPARPIWRRQAEAAPAPGSAGTERPALRLVKDGPDFELAPPAQGVPTPRAELSDVEAAVLDAVRAAGGPVRQKAVVETTGLAKGTVSKTVGRLVAAGHVVKAEDGGLTAAAGEVSA